jgi:hypothetical protein
MFKGVSPFLSEFDEVIDLIEKDVGCTYRMGINFYNDGRTRAQVMDFIDKTDPRRVEMRTQTLAGVEQYRKWQSGEYPLKGRYVNDGLVIIDDSGNVVAELPPPYEFLPKRIDVALGNPT